MRSKPAFCQLENWADWGVISAATVGRAFLANPDLIDRLRLGADLTEPDVATFYSPGPAGLHRLPDAGADRLSRLLVAALPLGGRQVEGPGEGEAGEQA